MTKKLVAFFSASGVTAKVAELIAKVTGADLYEIKPEQAYTIEDLDWRNPESRSSVEMKDPASRVALKDTCVNMCEYDTIIIGYPVWWGVAPHIINSFLEAYDMTGKTIIPFVTSGGSPVGDVEAYLGVSAKNATITNPIRLSAVCTEEEIENWLK